ncbi:efflux RND transporter periplasmic adaptor subunit, partial [Candidatus Sumerlaeota bacterium]|nr:efflux RND transporter periplasmic adaptor subunit [Candidatus Sumerlaeota bacterium]
MKPGRKYMRISGGVLFLVLVGVGLMALNSSSIPLEQLPRTKVQRGEFVVSIDELGVFKAEKKTIITSPFRGKVLKIVPDGSEVKANQTVIWLDTEDIADQLESQMTNLKSVKMELESSIAQLLNSIKNNTIDAELAQAELEFNRLKLQEVSRRLETLETLKEQSLIPRREIDDAERKVKAAKLSTRSSDFSFQEKLETLKTEEKINRQKLQDIGIKGNLSEQKIKECLAKLHLAEIKAPKSGVFVLTKRWRWRLRKMASIQEGDEVFENQTLAEIPDLSSLLIYTQVSESAISKIRVGMPVNINIDALKGKVIKGTITSIGRVAIERRRSPAGAISTSEENEDELAQKVFEIKVKPEELDKRIRPGMTAQVSFIIEQIPDAIFIPLK